MAMATPASSAVNVSRLMKNDATRLAAPKRGPSRSRTRSKTGRPAMAATRPHISAYTMMPATPTTTTHARFSSKRAPTAALATRSPMSTKPPMAVSTPRKMASTFFTTRSLVGVQERLELALIVVQRLGRGGEIVEAPAAHHDPDLADVVDGGRENVGQLVAQRVGPSVGRLDR